MSLSDFSQSELNALAADDKGPMSLAIILTFTIIAFLVLCVRFHVRFQTDRTQLAEDWVMYVAMVTAIVMAVCQGLQIKNGSGRHEIFVTSDENRRMLMWLWASILTFAVAITITKISILMTYRRIFLTSQRTIITIYIVGAIVVAFGLSVFISAIFSCVPVSAFWIVELLPTAKCVDVQSLWIANAALNMITDMAVALLPIYEVWHLNLPTRKRVGVSFLFALGMCVCIAAALRLHALVQLSRNPSRGAQITHRAELAYLAAVEVNLAIICSSLAPLRSIFYYLWRSVRGDSRVTASEEAQNNTGVAYRMSFIPIEDAQGRRTHRLVPVRQPAPTYIGPQVTISSGGQSLIEIRPKWDSITRSITSGKNLA